MADRHKRIKALISRNIADILQFELKKESVGLVSVNEVVVYDDLSQANVYVSFLDPRGAHNKLEELERTEGFVRSSLAKKLDIYKVPRIRFFLDEAGERARKLDEALLREKKQLESLPNGEDDED
ncbi:MAG: 30S ribosome-binding factor RbfA [Bacilli bacterium]|nr:30S ribosome-binding factor RbfA [Bacilli bacterium]